MNAWTQRNWRQRPIQSDENNFQLQEKETKYWNNRVQRKSNDLDKIWVQALLHPILLFTEVSQKTLQTSPGIMMPQRQRLTSFVPLRAGLQAVDWDGRLSPFPTDSSRSYSVSYAFRVIKILRDTHEAKKMVRRRGKHRCNALRYLPIEPNFLIDKGQC